MNYLSDKLLVVINLLVQSGMQSMFLVLYYRTRHKVRDFWLLMAVFNLIIFPVNLAFFQNELTLKNILNMVLLMGACRLIFSQESWKRLFAGIVLYELALVVTLFLEVGLIWMIFQKSIEELVQIPSALVLAYFYSDLGLFCVLVIVLKFFSLPFNRKIATNSYIISLLLNLILCGLCWLTISIPLYSGSFHLDYMAVFTLLILINVLTFASFIRQIHRSSRQKAIEKIRSVYRQQVDDYLLTEKEEAKLRQLRHDLLNFIQSSQKQADEPRLRYLDLKEKQL